MTTLVFDLFMIVASEEEWDMAVFGKNYRALFKVLDLWVFESDSNWTNVIVYDWAEF